MIYEVTSHSNRLEMMERFEIENLQIVAIKSIFFAQQGDHCILEKNWNIRFSIKAIENLGMNGASSGPTFYNSQVGRKQIFR